MPEAVNAEESGKMTACGVDQVGSRITQAEAGLQGILRARSHAEASYRERDQQEELAFKNWRLGRMAAVDRNILRLAVFEFLCDTRTPKTVVINEALEIAKKYSTHESAQFVNGVLDSVKSDLKEKEAEY